MLLDTSVLVAGLISEHEHESRAAVWLDAARRGRVRGAATTHALAETWATLTALPVEPRVPAPLAERMVERLVVEQGPRLAVPPDPPALDSV